MAEFQHMDGSAVTSPLTAVVGNALHLKVIPASKQPLPTVGAIPASVVKVTHVGIHKTANFTVFKLEAVSAGKAILQGIGSSPGTILAGPIDIVVESRLSLPAASTNAGLFVRLFLAETPSPDEMNYTSAEAKTAMSWMRVVVENRLKKPSGVWASAGATTLADVVKAKGQFEGFSHYPTLPAHIRKNIDDAIRIANDGDDSRRNSFKMFVEAALAVAAMPVVTDPSQAGLFWWRTDNSGKPSDTVKVFASKLGNTFFTP